MGHPKVWLPEWDGPLYAANTGHHRRHDAVFTSSLPLRTTDRVLDIGCGAGDFTATVAALVPDGEVVGLDPQASLLDEARKVAQPNQSFVEGPAQRLTELLAQVSPFDVVMSRAALHWIPWADHAGVLAGCHAVLRPGGVLRVECGGGDNVREVVAFLDDIATPFGAAGVPWTFAAAGAYLDLLEATGFVVGDNGFVRTVAQRREFDRDGVLGWLFSQCVQAYEIRIAPGDRPQFRAEIESRVDELRRADGTYDLTFVRLDLLAFREPADAFE